MGGFKSDVWQYFTIVGSDKVKCDLCKTVYSSKGGISNMKKHLKNKHPTIEINSGSYKYLYYDYPNL